MTTSGNPIAIICRFCGSKDVARDAWAEWDEKDQRWVLRGDPFDAATCFNCDDEASLEEIELIDAFD